MRRMMTTAFALVLLAGASARAQSYTYDAEGRLISARYSATNQLMVGYDAAGNITNFVRAGALSEPDADADALPDAWEWVYFNTLTNAAGG